MSDNPQAKQPSIIERTTHNSIQYYHHSIDSNECMSMPCPPHPIRLQYRHSFSIDDIPYNYHNFGHLKSADKKLTILVKRTPIDFDKYVSIFKLINSLDIGNKNARELIKRNNNHNEDNSINESNVSWWLIITIIVIVFVLYQVNKKHPLQ